MTGPDVIECGNGYHISSYGNGLFYRVQREADGASVLLQGDDATVFRFDYDNLYATREAQGREVTRRDLDMLLDEYPYEPDVYVPEEESCAEEEYELW